MKTLALILAFTLASQNSALAFPTSDVAQSPPVSKVKTEIQNYNSAKRRVKVTLRSGNPFSALSSSFWVKDDLVQENVLELWTANRQGRMILAYVDAKYCETCDRFDVVPCEDIIASVASASVGIGSGSRLEQKRAAFAFNTSCLTSLKGCTTIADLAPALWRRTATGGLQCTTAHRP